MITLTTVIVHFSLGGHHHMETWLVSRWFGGLSFCGAAWPRRPMRKEFSLLLTLASSVLVRQWIILSGVFKGKTEIKSPGGRWHILLLEDGN